MKILGIDPGMTTGWSLAVKDSAYLGGFKWIKGGDVKYKDFEDFFYPRVPKVDLVVCEDYVLNPKVQKWAPAAAMYNRLITKELVGVIRAFCWIHKVRLILQESKIKPMGYQLNGLPYVKNSRNSKRHEWDAMAHIRNLLRVEFDI